MIGEVQYNLSEEDDSRIHKCYEEGRYVKEDTGWRFEPFSITLQEQKENQ